MLYIFVLYPVAHSPDPRVAGALFNRTVRSYPKRSAQNSVLNMYNLFFSPGWIDLSHSTAGCQVPHLTRVLKNLKVPYQGAIPIRY